MSRGENKDRKTTYKIQHWDANVTVELYSQFGSAIIFDPVNIMITIRTKILTRLPL